MAHMGIIVTDSFTTERPAKTIRFHYIKQIYIM